jgi:hypothetical protein
MLQFPPPEISPSPARRQAEVAGAREAQTAFCGVFFGPVPTPQLLVPVVYSMPADRV